MVLGRENREYLDNDSYKMCNVFPITGASERK